MTPDQFEQLINVLENLAQSMRENTLRDVMLVALGGFIGNYSCCCSSGSIGPKKGTGEIGPLVYAKGVMKTGKQRVFGHNPTTFLDVGMRYSISTPKSR